MERQKFVTKFRTYEETLFKPTERDHFNYRQSNDTLGNLYFRVVEWLCTRVVASMVRFHTLEKRPNKKDNTPPRAPHKVPLSTVHALYKMKEFHVPVYDAVSYDVDLLCIVCKLHPIYKPCTRSAKKISCQRFNSQCLQCFVEHEVTTGERCSIKIFDLVCNIELGCHCHRNYMCLLFPSFMLFASESSRKMVLRVCVMTTLADMLSKTEGGDMSAMNKRIDSRISGQVGNTSGDSSRVEKKQYVDRQYL